jgi:hypothetical protein
MQEKLKSNIGDLVRKLGGKFYKKSKKSADVLIDPHNLFKQVQIGNYFLFLLKYFDK